MVQMPEHGGGPIRWDKGELAAIEAAELKDERNARIRKLGLGVSALLVLWGLLQIVALEPFVPTAGFAKGLSTMALGVAGIFASLAAFPSSIREEHMLDDLGLDSLDPMP